MVTENLINVAWNWCPSNSVSYFDFKNIQFKSLLQFNQPWTVYLESELLSWIQPKLDVETHFHISKLIQLRWKSIVTKHQMGALLAMSNVLTKNSNPHKKSSNVSRVKEEENLHQRRLISDVQFLQVKMVWSLFSFPF